MGELSPDLETKSVLWRLVKEYGQPVSEVFQWDLPTIRDATSLLDMQADYQSATEAFLRPEKK